ncbi:MAG: PD-(D/E)XK nuclease family protein [Bauldia sp.]
MRSALELTAVAVTAADGSVEALEWPTASSPAVAGAGSAPAATGPVEIPDWATRAAPPAPPPRARLTPSSASAEGAAAPPLSPRNDPASAAALERGRLVHRLLESLPDIPAERRVEIGAAYLAAFADDWPQADRDALLAEVLAVLDDPAFAEAFAPGSRAEVEIAGRLGAASIAGRIDRLAVTPGRVLIVDYKTNRPAPETPAEVPPAYVGQLALYRAVLRRLYPGRTVAAALLWTDRPALMEIPESDLILAETVLAGR